MSRALNFNAGPGTLPLPALERARDELLDFAGTGASVMELSHRGAEYGRVHEEAIERLRRLIRLPDDYEVLFLQGGASQHFAQVPMNFLPAGASADYVVTGAWGEKALAEAQRVAHLAGARVRVAASTALEDAGQVRYTRVPGPHELQPDPAAAYLHLTSNETIDGVQFRAPDAGHDFPTVAAPLVCDMSSDFLWRPFDASRFAFVYAGAQKNVGPSGLVVALARRDFLERGRTDLPKVFQYRTAAEARSLYNTPPTFSIYLVAQVLRWLEEQGGLEAIERVNLEKARTVYDVIDRHAGFYRCPVERTSRSAMNVVFHLPSEALEAAFVAEAKAQRMVGLQGHRSVGGIRASLYNAVPLEWARTLADFMDDFVRRHG